MNSWRLLVAAALLWAAAVWGAPAPAAQEPNASLPADAVHADALFETSHNCVACHNNLVTPSGEDVSIGSSWRATMMANSSRDPYWQAAVRRETIDHPTVGAVIEDECAICHMPMARTLAHAQGREGRIFANLPVGSGTTPEHLLAADGVSCMICHQITPERLGTRDSFTGGYVVNTVPSDAPRAMFGPFEIDEARTAIMRSSTGVQPTEAAHLRDSAFCATCHTLYTQAVGPDGQPIGSLPEQVPFLEWRHSAYEGLERGCQSCHMPAIEDATRISSTFGELRTGQGRHAFIGGNFVVLRMLNAHRIELGVEALPHELEGAIDSTIRQLQSATATLSMARASVDGRTLNVDVAVANQTGHKFPTAYPARRAWLHLTVRDRSGRTVFESGAIRPTGEIVGNDNDADAARFEPHYTEITSADQVQIYESVMVDSSGMPTTGLLRGLRFVKDNRLLPQGFDKTTAEPDIAVHGGAEADADFGGDGDRIRYSVPVADSGPFDIEVELRYQPIGYRWAHNLEDYDAAEPRRFVSYYEAMSAASSVLVARAAGRTN